MSPCLIGMEACVGAHHLSRKLKALGHVARLMPARYVRPYSKGQKNDFRDAEAVAEAVQRPTMKFVVTKTADQLDLQALHRVHDRLVQVRLKNPGTPYQISVDGIPSTYRDRQDIALQTARFLKSRNPKSTVKLKDLQTGEETVVAFEGGTDRMALKIRTGALLPPAASARYSARGRELFAVGFGQGVICLMVAGR